VSGNLKKEKDEVQSKTATPQSSIRENADTEISATNRDQPPPNSCSDTWIGRIIDDRYEIVERLGEGGMGAVFVAKHLKLDKEVAFKVILPTFSGDGEIAARFAREAMATAKFEHPHVASAIDYGTLPEGGAYFVMQLVRGDSLNTLLEKEGRLHWSRAAEIGAQLADALSAAAAYDIVHRDLKPENIIIQKREDRSDLVKILDFGIARHTRDSIPVPNASGEKVKRKLTRDGAVVGTPGYMAPEQAIGDRAGHAADLYALGVVIWECIAGRQLWIAEDLSKLIQSQLTAPVPSLRELLPEEDIPEEIDRLILQLLAVRPQDRPEQAGVVRDIFRQFSLAATANAFPLSEIRTGSQETISLGKTPSGSKSKKGKQDEPRRRFGLYLTIGIFAILSFVAFFGLNRLGDNPWQKIQELLATTKTVKTTLINTVKTVVEKQGTNPQFQKLARGLNIPTPSPQEKPNGPPDNQPATTTSPLNNETKEKAIFKQPEPESKNEQETVPSDLSQLITPLMEGSSRDERVAAAERFLSYSPASSVPKYLLAVARLQKGTLCSEKKAALDDIVTLKDKRTLPALTKLSKQRRMDCGPKKNVDCLGCLRQELSVIIDQLENKDSSSASP
jgi:eukaryotic-like serine/threonine-protein kinase